MSSTHDAEQEVRAGLLAALKAWSESLYPCPIKTCNCKAKHHLRRLDAEMVRQTRAAIAAAEKGASG